MSSPWQIQFQDLKSRSKHIFETKTLSDCTFLVGQEKQSVEGHKLILSIASPVLEEKLRLAAEDHPKITITDVEPQVFQSMLKYIYTDAIDFDASSVFDLADAAKTYQLPGLLKECLNTASKSLTEKSVLQVYRLALHTTENDLKQKCEEFLERNTKAVLADSSFEEACLDVIEAMFSLENLDIESELELLTAADRYAKHAAKCEQTDTSIRNVLAKIRFLSLTPEEFAKGQSDTSVLSPDDACAILAHIAYDESKTPMPPGFSLRRDARKNKIIPFKPWHEIRFELNVPDIKNISDEVYSPTYLLWNLKWRVYVKKAIHLGKDYLSIFTDFNWENTSNTWSCLADVDFILRADNGKHYKQNFTEKYVKEHHSWGFNFTPMDNLLNPINHYIKDGGITFEIRIRSYEPEGIE